MVLAMHRSGTSLVASWLEACGLRMAMSRRLGAGVANTLGHFEDLDFVDLHSRSIRRQVRRSQGWKVRSPRPLQFDDGEAREADKLISARLRAGEPWGWKDPRTILFAEQWKSRMPDLQALVLRREGTKVIDSLVARSRKKAGWPIDKIGYVEASLVYRAHSVVLGEYVSRHGQDLVACSVEDLVRTDGRALIDVLSERCRAPLQYVSLQEFFQSRLMNREKVSRRSTLLFDLVGGRALDRRLSSLLPDSFSTYVSG